MCAWRLSVFLVVQISGVFAEEVLFPTSSEDAKIRYGDIGQQILDRLTANSDNISTSFNVLLYAGGCTQYEKLFVKFDSCPCMEHKTEDASKYNSSVPKVLVQVDGYTNVNVFRVAIDTNKTSSEALRDEWQRIQKERERIMKKTFNDDEDEIVSIPDCISIDFDLRKEAGFRAVTAFRCARRFVWYELGWTYFEAYWTNSEYVLRSDNWADKLGQGTMWNDRFIPLNNVLGNLG